MDTIDKWLKSLRLHKYTYLFKNLSYDQMLSLEEDYLIEREVTKGARNKMLVSVKKLNLRHERLINMIDDLNQGSISMKEALTVLKDMLITPIPPPPQSLLQQSDSCSVASSITSTSPSYSSSSTCSRVSSSYSSSISPQSQSPVQSPGSTSSATSLAVVAGSQYELTYLFIETLEKVVQRLIESAGLEDTACHGIVATILDECLRHNSFSMEQKVKLAGLKQNFTTEHKAKLAGLKQNFIITEQKPRLASFNKQKQHHHQYNNNNQQLLLQQQQDFTTSNYQQRYRCSQTTATNYQNHQLHFFKQHHQHLHNLLHRSSPGHHTSPRHQQQQQQQQQQQTQLQRPQFHQHPQKPPSSPGSPTSTTGDYKEYSLLGPGATFELPYLRTLVAKHQQQHHLHQLEQHQSPAEQQKPLQELNRYAFVTSDPVGWSWW